MSNRKTTRRSLLAAGVSTGMIGVAGCIGSISGGSGGSSGIDADLFNRITQSHYPVLPYSVAPMIMEEKGFLEDEGLEPPSEILGSSGGGTTLRNLTSGDLPWGMVACSATVQGYYKGASVQILGGTTPAIANLVWMIDADTEFNHPRDAKGMSIGFTSPGSTTEAVSHLVIELTDGITPDDVEFKGLGGVSENITALKQGNVDIGVVIPGVMGAMTPDFKVAWNPTEYLPRYQQGVMVTSSQVLEDHSEELRAFIRAYDKACQFLHDAQTDDAKYEEAKTIYAENNDFDEAYAEASLGFIRDGPAGLNNFYRTDLSNEGLARVHQSMDIKGSLDTELNWDDVVDQSLLPENRRIDLNPGQYYS